MRTSDRKDRDQRHQEALRLAMDVASRLSGIPSVKVLKDCAERLKTAEMLCLSLADDFGGMR